MKIKTGDISIVENAGTFLLWYDKNSFGPLDSRTQNFPQTFFLG
jgi:hypothetical protein